MPPIETKVFDVIIVGLGAMGSAAAYHASRRGLSVLGIEQFESAHDRGSSHGETRLTRQAYFEHPDYVPLLIAAHKNWTELNQICSEELFKKTGLVIFGQKQQGSVLSRSMESAKRHGIAVKYFEPSKVQESFSQFEVPGGMGALWEPGAGYLRVEKIVEAHSRLAQEKGAELHFREKVLEWAEDEGQVWLRSERGRYEAKSLIVTGGAWSSDLLMDMNLSLSVHRNFLFWYGTQKQEWKELPCFAYDLPDAFYYGFPSCADQGLKVAQHIPGETVGDPLRVDRSLREGESDAVDCFVSKYLNGDAEITAIDHAVCLYTMSKDGHFLLGRHPRMKRVHFAAGFSGHGFKFSTVIGEVLSAWAAGEKSPYNVDFLSWKRFKA